MSCSVSCDTTTFSVAPPTVPSLIFMRGFQNPGLVSTLAVQIRKLIVSSIFTKSFVPKDFA